MMQHQNYEQNYTLHYQKKDYWNVEQILIRVCLVDEK